MIVKLCLVALAVGAALLSFFLPIRRALGVLVGLVVVTIITLLGVATAIHHKSVEQFNAIIFAGAFILPLATVAIALLLAAGLAAGVCLRNRNYLLPALLFAPLIYFVWRAGP